MRFGDDFELVLCVGEAHGLVARIGRQLGSRLGIRLGLVLEGLIGADDDVVSRDCNSTTARGCCLGWLTAHSCM